MHGWNVFREGGGGSGGATGDLVGCAICGRGQHKRKEGLVVRVRQRGARARERRDNGAMKHVGLVGAGLHSWDRRSRGTVGITPRRSHSFLLHERRSDKRYLLKLPLVHVVEHSNLTLHPLHLLLHIFIKGLVFHNLPLELLDPQFGLVPRIRG